MDYFAWIDQNSSELTNNDAQRRCEVKKLIHHEAASKEVK
jgi:hypothetical protein